MSLHYAVISYVSFPLEKCVDPCVSIAPLRYQGCPSLFTLPHRAPPVHRGPSVVMCFMSSVLTHSCDTGTGGGLSILKTEGSKSPGSERSHGPAGPKPRLSDSSLAPRLGRTTVLCANSKVSWGGGVDWKKPSRSFVQGLSDSFCDLILKHKTVWFYRPKKTTSQTGSH